MRKKLFLFFVFLLATVSGAMAQDYAVTLKSEYTSVPTIYAGVQNYMTLKVTNNGEYAENNVNIAVFLGGVNIFEETIANISAGETITKNFYDTTIRPIDEHTIKGNGNTNVDYTVKIGGVEQGTFSFVVLYNGNLGKDYEYPSANPQLREFTFTGDVQVLTGTNYSGASVTERNDVFSVDLGEGESVCKALLYVSYNWENPNYNSFTTSTTTFNGNTISSIASYRDQGNLGNYGNYGYGMVVYDVTNYMVSGDNTFHLDKTGTNVAVYPSSLIVMVNKPSGNPKAVYILEEADLLANTYTQKNESVTPIYESSFADVVIGNAANLYVFAANAQKGEGDLIINGNKKSDVWSGTSQTFDTYTCAVDPGDVSVKFVANGSTIMALHQMLVVDMIKGNEGNTGEYWATYYNGTKSCVADANTTVYQASVNSSKTGVVLTEVTGREIPAGKGVVLKSTSTTIMLTPATTTQTLDGNELQGSDVDLATPTNAYCLSKETTRDGGLTPRGVGFYTYTLATIPAHRAYLVVEGGPNPTRGFLGFGDDDNTTGISLPEAVIVETDGPIYDLSGRRVTGQPHKGIYVKDGKKFVIK